MYGACTSDYAGLVGEIKEASSLQSFFFIRCSSYNCRPPTVSVRKNGPYYIQKWLSKPTNHNKASWASTNQNKAGNNNNNRTSLGTEA